MSATTSVEYLSLPSLSCHLRVWSRPSMYTWRPLDRKRWAFSAVRPNTTTVCHSVWSLQLPSRSRRRSVVAMRRLPTDVPDWVERISGSRPRLPTRMTLLTVIVSSLMVTPRP